MKKEKNSNVMLLKWLRSEKVGKLPGYSSKWGNGSPVIVTGKLNDIVSI